MLYSYSLHGCLAKCDVDSCSSFIIRSASKGAAKVGPREAGGELQANEPEAVSDCRRRVG